MTTQPGGRRPSNPDATVGLYAIAILILAAVYGVPLAIILWRAAL
jgi:hypothetical protein